MCNFGKYPLKNNICWIKMQTKRMIYERSWQGRERSESCCGCQHLKGVTMLEVSHKVE